MMELTQKQISEMREGLKFAMEQHARNIDGHLWKEMESALKSDSSLKSLFKYQYDPLLKFYGISLPEGCLEELKIEGIGRRSAGPYCYPAT